MDTYVCLDCKRLFEGVSTELQDFSTEIGKPLIDRVDVKSIQCLFCSSYNNIKWDPTIGLCPKCGSTMTFETQGEIKVKPFEVKKVIKEKPINVKEIKSVEEVYKNGLFTINGIDKDNNLYPITHKGDPERIGKPMTDEELHVFGVELVLVYYHYQNGNIIL